MYARVMSPNNARLFLPQFEVQILKLRCSGGIPKFGPGGLQGPVENVCGSVSCPKLRVTVDFRASHVA